MTNDPEFTLKQVRELRQHADAMMQILSFLRHCQKDFYRNHQLGDVEASTERVYNMLHQTITSESGGKE